MQVWDNNRIVCKNTAESLQLVIAFEHIGSN